jgi:hypothetical protein
VKDKHENKAKCPGAGDPAENILPSDNRPGKKQNHASILIIPAEYFHGNHGDHQKHPGGN